MLNRRSHSRRAFLRNAVVTGTSLGLAPLMSSTLLKASPGAEGTVTLGIPGLAPTLDPLNLLNHDWMVVTQMMYENLIEFDVDGNLKPQLAVELPKVSADGLVYEFTLRSDVTFGNGAPFSAEDVKYSFDYLLDPANKATRRPIFSRIKEVTVLDPMHVRFTLSEPYAPWLAFMTKCMGIFPKGSREVVSADAFRAAPVGLGTGPAIFESWQANDHIALKRNPNYWGKGVPAWERLVVKQLPEDAARVAYIRTGQADIISAPPPREFAQLKSVTGLAGASRPTLGGWFAFYMDNSKPPFDDVNVRRAISHAIDREMLAKRIYFGLLDASGTIAPPSAWWYSAAADKAVKYDINLAKKYMAESKYKDGFTFDLTIPSTAYLLDVRDAALVAQAAFAKIGISAKIKVMEFAPMLSSIIAGNEQASLWIQMSPGEPTYHVQNCLTPGQALLGSTKFQNPKIVEYLKQAFAETDQEKLKPIYDKMALFLAEESPIVWIGFVHAANVWRQRVHDFTVNQGITLNPKPAKLS
jgi:peptide/nickel transport system substrate-binding protein